MTRIAQRLKAHEGSAMVEMALVLPILLALAIAIVDFGRAINYWNDVNQIAADGARFAAVNKSFQDDPDTPEDESDLRYWLRTQAVTRELRDAALEDADADEACPDVNNPDCSQSVGKRLQVCVDSPTGEPLTIGHPIRIRVESTYNLIPIRMLPGIGSNNDIDSVAIKGDAVMRLEQNYTGGTGCVS